VAGPNASESVQVAGAISDPLECREWLERGLPLREVLQHVLQPLCCWRCLLCLAIGEIRALVLAILFSKCFQNAQKGPNKEAQSSFLCMIAQVDYRALYAD